METALSFMAKQEAGLAMIAEATIDNKSEAVILVKEETKYIKRLGYSPVFDLRAGIFDIDNVAAVVVQFMINFDSNMLYEFFYNYHCEDSKILFDNLISQKHLIVIFINEKGEITRKIQIKNGLKETLLKCENIFKSRKWSMGEFDKVKEQVYKYYPTPQILFENLNRY